MINQCTVIANISYKGWEQPCQRCSRLRPVGAFIFYSHTLQKAWTA